MDNQKIKNINEEIVPFELLFLENLFAENIISKTLFDLTRNDLLNEQKVYKVEEELCY